MTTFGKKPLVTLAILLISVSASFAQNPGNIVLGRQDTTRRPITTAVPFLSFAPDSRASGMGDVGVATSADANSVHWNNGKLAFIDQSYGFSVSYSPWLGNIVPDMSLSYVSGFYKIDRLQTVAVSMRYFDLGSILKTGLLGEPQGEENPRELAFDGTYSRKLNEHWGIGVTGRYIWSNLVGNLVEAGKIGQSVSVDIGTYYTKDIVLGSTNSNLSFGAHISNIGQKVSYSSDAVADYIPINLRLGGALKMELDPYNSLTLAMDFNKLLVPTPPIYLRDEDTGEIIEENGNPVIARGKDPNRNLISGMFGSFADAPDGFTEEMQEIMIATGAEYWYREIFAARAGYFYEHKAKGGRQYLTLGVGFRYQVFGVDFSYLIPGDQNHPLAETVRFSLLFNFDKVDESDN